MCSSDLESSEPKNSKPMAEQKKSISACVDVATAGALLRFGSTSQNEDMLLRIHKKRKVSSFRGNIAEIFLFQGESFIETE